MQIEILGEKVANILEKYDKISFAYIQGSKVEGKDHENSNPDAAIYTGEELEAREISRITIDLEKKIGGMVYVSLLKDSDIIFQHQVLNKGELVFVRDEGAKVDFETGVYRLYDDYKPFFDTYNQLRSSVKA